MGLLMRYCCRGENRDAVEICMLKTMEPEDEVIGLTMGQDVSWLQATLMKVCTFIDRGVMGWDLLKLV